MGVVSFAGCLCALWGFLWVVLPAFSLVFGLVVDVSAVVMFVFNFVL